MDIAAISRVDSIVLTGLDFSMRPENVRYEVEKGFIKPFPEIKVMHQIKTLAIMVYNQEKMTPYYHANVCDGKNSLAYFICAVHRQTAPQSTSKIHSRKGSASSASSGGSASSCTSNQPGKNCELPKLVTTSMLPLGYWDSLYYAVIAEICQLHSDLQNRFGFGCELATNPLHYSGPDGTTDQPITAIDLASMLETAWYTLMYTRLVATLDNAVRMRKMRESAAKEAANKAEHFFTSASTSDMSHVSESAQAAAQFTPSPTPEGLIDINALSPEAIFSLLWDIHAPEIDRACLEDFEDESMLTAYRAELHAREVERSIAASTALPSARPCKCHRTCLCRFKCDQDAGQCTCMNGRLQVYHLVREQEKKKGELQSKYIKQYPTIPNQFLGAATNSLAQMQIAALAEPNPVTVQGCRSISAANDERERRLASKNRQRSNTNNSDLAYVPAPKANRGPKDAYPLGFYGRNSGYRYPNLPQENATTRHDAHQSQSMYHGTNVPARKPVPPPIITAQYHYPYQRSSFEAQNQWHAPTPPPSSPYDVQTFTQNNVVTYPAIPASQSDATLTKSFPAPTAGNPRTVKEHAQDGFPLYHDYRDDNAVAYAGLLERHPSAMDEFEQHTEQFPRLSRPAISSPLAKAITADDLPTLKTLDALRDKPQLVLPLPDFISPQPAAKQRYVSAGGNTRLSDRAEITGPALNTSHTASGRGTISKEEIDAKLSDPEWVRKNFGDAAAAAMTNTPRPSADSNQRNSKPVSKRNSDDDVDYNGGTKRDRLSSGASNSLVKMKRIFSRKHSQSETD